MEIKRKFKQLIFQAVAILNTVEGIIHLIVASIGFWGCFDLKVFDFRVLLPNIENFIFGIFSILTGVIMSKWSTDKKPELTPEEYNLNDSIDVLLDRIKELEKKREEVYTTGERQLDVRIDCQHEQREAAYQKPEFIKMPFGFNFRENDDWRTCRQCG